MPLSGPAAARLYDDHVDAVHALLARRVGPELSPVVVAETFEHALHTWDRFDRDGGTERLFLFGAAVTVLRSHADEERAHLASLAVRADHAGGTDVRDPLVNVSSRRAPRVVDHAANEDLLASDDVPVAAGSSLMGAISELAPDDRDIVLLSLWESCPQSAIAEVLDLSVGAVRSALGRIRRELKVAASTADRS